MTTLPISLLVNLLLGLFSLAILGAGVALLANALRRSRPRPVVRETVVHGERERPPVVEHAESAVVGTHPLYGPATRKMLLSGLALFLVALLGRHIVQLAFPPGE